MINSHQSFWNTSGLELLNSLKTTMTGLITDYAKKRLTCYDVNRLKPKKRSDVLTFPVTRFKSPIITILLPATGLSFLLHNMVDAFVILTILKINEGRKIQ